MPMKFDATMKELAQEDPAAFLGAFDTPPTQPVKLLNVDLSTVTAAADLVFGIGPETAYTEIVHIDVQSGPDAKKGLDVLAYNALVHRLYAVPVHSILLLLQSKAGHSDVTGGIAYSPRPGKGKMDFEFEVVPLWKWPAEGFLTGPLNLVPLAGLAQMPGGLAPEDALGGIIRRMVERLDREAEPGRARKLVTAGYLLTGLRFRDRSIVDVLFGDIDMIQESVTYQGILDDGRKEGRLDEARQTVLRLGQKHLGAPGDGVRAALAALADLDRLRRMTDRVDDVGSWDELLQIQ
jgi:hypothetical protein